MMARVANAARLPVIAPRFIFHVWLDKRFSAGDHRKRAAGE
jgi:hypothetical protein